MAEQGVAANNVGPGAAPEAAVENNVVNEPDDHGDDNDAGGNVVGDPPPVENGQGGMPVAGVLRNGLELIMAPNGKLAGSTDFP